MVTTKLTAKMGRRQLATIAARKKGPTVSVYVRIEGREGLGKKCARFEENAELISALDEEIE